MFQDRKYPNPFWKRWVELCQENNVLFSDVYVYVMDRVRECPFCLRNSPLTWQSEGQCRICDEFLLSEEDILDFVK
jgi:hypothetical protein